MPYNDFRFGWYATFCATALEDDPAKLAEMETRAAADLRHGLVRYVELWRGAFGDDFTEDELTEIVTAATADLTGACVGEAVTHG